MKKLLIICALFATTGGLYEGRAQQVGVKTNLLYDATATFNLGAEFRLGGRTSLDIPVNWNPFEFGENRKWKHFLVQPELRLWTKETFHGHFFGLHTHYALYNVGNLPKPFSTYMRTHRFEGWLAGAGISYGYRWSLSHRWAMEATAGVGYAYMKYDKFTCGRCGESLGNEVKHYFGPTKVGLSLIYNIGGRKPVAEPLPVVIIVTEPEPQAVIPYTPRFAVSYTVPAVETVKRRSDAGKAYLDFEVNKYGIVAGFRDNAAELQKISDLIEEVRNDPNATITGITITGYASPEGAFEANRTLSGKRAEALKNLIHAMYGFPERLFTVEGAGEDWTTFEELVSLSSIADRDALLGIIRGEGTPDQREKKLRELSGGSTFRQINAELFPQLRRTEYELHYTVAPFTPEQAREVFKVKPSVLSLNEMFLIAKTYRTGSDEFNEVIETAAHMFPQDDTANLNAAASALGRGDAVAAANYLSGVKARNAEYHNNMGILHGLRGEWDKAAAEFRKAHAAGNGEAAHNLDEVTRKLENIEAVKRTGKI